MLGKLLKYEFKATSRTFVPLYIALVLVAIINNLFMTNDISFGFGIMIMIMVGLFIALGVLTLVVLIQRFNKNLLGDEGYLMFTLPVKPYQLILSKLLITVFWTIISGIIAIITFIILVGGFNFTFIKEFFTVLFTQMDVISNAIGTAMQEEAFRQALVMMITFCFIALFTYVGSILEIYLALSIGQLPVFSKHRGITAFVAFFVINSILQMLVMFVGGTFMHTFSILSPGMLCTLGILGSLLVDVILFFIINYILNKHLNLE
nr:ABC transporter permease [uncultured Cellulosilyticum sp.]